MEKLEGSRGKKRREEVEEEPAGWNWRSLIRNRQKEDLMMYINRPAPRPRKSAATCRDGSIAFDSRGIGSSFFSA